MASETVLGDSVEESLLTWVGAWGKRSRVPRLCSFLQRAAHDKPLDGKMLLLGNER